jgi:hypothetical protein
MADERKFLSDRAKARLRHARQLMQSDPPFFGLQKGWKLNDAGGVYEAIQAAIEGLAEPAREKLRGLVDWVEEYDQAETAAAPSAPRPS